MRPAFTLVLTAAATAVLALTGCGGSSNGGPSGTAPASSGGPAAASPSANPKQAVTAALTKLTREPHRQRLLMKTDIVTHGVPAAAASAFGRATTITAHGDFESARRVSLVESVPPTLTDAHFVLYDGASYIATDGVHFQRLKGALATSVSGLAELGADRIAKYIIGVRALGTTTIAGKSVAHYRAAVDAKGAKSLTHSVGGPLGALTDAVDVGSSRLDVYIDAATGQIVRTVTIASSTFDLAKMPPSLGSGLKGTLAMHQRITSDISDPGAKITVERPHTSGRALQSPSASAPGDAPDAGDGAAIN
ncbi:MAG TPA: hypothetical protein VHZ31_01720 [Solirubrobacteraceae bacterium]|nr:hypothetical protein [Solirubrobacteraceae bacterium]